MDNSKIATPTLIEVLRSTPWTSELDADSWARVEASTIERHVPAGGFICHKGDAVEYWFGVISGLVKLSCDSIDGKTTTLAGIPAGGWLGEGSLLKNEPRRYDGIALRDCRIACVPRSLFVWLLDHSISFNRFLLVQLNERLSQFIGLVESDRLLDTDARVARCLAQLFNPVLYPNTGRRLSVSQEEVGHLTGISRQSVNCSLKELQHAGFLKVEYGGITILDLSGLRRFCG